MKKLFLPLSLIVFFSVLAGVFVWWQGNKETLIRSPYAGEEQKSVKEKEKPLSKYTFENIKKRGSVASTIKTLGRVQPLPGSDPSQGFTSFLFSYTSDERKITGLMNIPGQIDSGRQATGSADIGKPPYPVIIMIRGYVDQEIYEPGVGTRRAGEYFAQRGYITLAPDFLGYGDSDDPPDNVWEERFLRPIAVMDLIASVYSLPEADPDSIYLWGHSNGGMIAMSVLALTGMDYPTTLWAPVSQYFPYDVLYYTNEFDDGGKALRASLAEFEEDYNTDDYSFSNYLEWIKAPIQLHQGTADEYIPVFWSNQLVDRLNKLEIDIDYYTYPGADHNMNGAWSQVVERDLVYFSQY